MSFVLIQTCFKPLIPLVRYLIVELATWMPYKFLHCCALLGVTAANNVCGLSF